MSRTRRSKKRCPKGRSRKESQSGSRTEPASRQRGGGSHHGIGVGGVAVVAVGGENINQIEDNVIDAGAASTAAVTEMKIKNEDIVDQQAAYVTQFASAPVAMVATSGC